MICPGCGIEIPEGEPACESCQKEELNRQMNEQIWRQYEEEYYQAERDAGRL